MVITGDIRGNGAQLGLYLITLKDNSHIRILEVDGRDEADEEYLQLTVMGMELNSELTKTDKAFLHVQLSPAIGEDEAMSDDDWHLAADILAQETGFTDQRRVIVLHTKKGRTHAHVVFERYHHATGKMIDNKHSRLKMDAARPQIETALNQQLTPRRNPQRMELKEAVTKLWNETQTGAEFVKAATKQGYIIAEGTGSRPFMIVDENGRSFNLVRQIDGVRTKEVRARLRHEKLMTDKQAIEHMREKQANSSGKQDQQQITHKPSMRHAAESFAENRQDTMTANETAKTNSRPKVSQFKAANDDMTEKPPVIHSEEELRKQKIAQQFADNRNTAAEPATDKERRRQEALAEQERIKQKIGQRHKPKL